MKNFSKFISCLLAFVMCISMLDFSGGLSAYSSIDNGFSDEQIAESSVKPNITIDRKSLLYSDACCYGYVDIDIVLSGANLNNNYCNTGFRIMFPKDVSGYYNSYDQILTVATDKDGNPNVKAGEAIEELTSHVEWCTNEYGTKTGIYLSTEGDGNKGKTGVMYTIRFKLPSRILGGVNFPIKIEYQDGDLFTNYENDETGKLMQSYLFTKGINNGNVHIDFRTDTAPPATTTTTELITTTTTTTTSSTYYTGDYTTGTYILPDTSAKPITTTTTYYYTTTTTTLTTYTYPPTTTSTTTTTPRTYTYPPTTTSTTTTVPTTTTTTTTAPVVTGIGYENWTMFEDTIVSIGDDKVTFAGRGKTAVLNNGYNMEKIKNAGVGSKVSVEAIVSPSGSILNIINLEVIKKADIITGDANGDNDINIADAILIMQSLSNPNEYKLTEQGLTNADVVNRGDGVTAIDALAIQLIGLKLINAEDFPITTEDLDKLIN